MILIKTMNIIIKRNSIRNLIRVRFENEIELYKGQVVDYCRKCFSGYFEKKYSDSTKYFNVVSLKTDIPRLILITKTSCDKSKINKEDIVLVVRETTEGNKTLFRDKYKFIYTSEIGDLPSQETPLNYELHQRLRKKIILHAHPENILETAWNIPRKFADEDNDDYFNGGAPFSLPTTKGRGIRFNELAEKMINKLNGKADAVLGTRHGLWVLDDDSKSF